MKYVQLKEGQYFIYKDTATGLTDSVIVAVSSLTTDTWHTTQGEPATREIFQLQLVADKPVTDSTWIDGRAEASELSNDFYLSGNFLFFAHPCGSCNPALSQLPSIIVEGKTYTDVIVTQNNSQGNTYYNFYWAPSVGLIRVEKQVLYPSTRKVFTLLRHG